MSDHPTGISLRDVRKLIDEKPMGEQVFEAVDRLLDLVILLSPAVVGPVAGLALFALIEPKNALVKLGRDAIKKFAKPGPGDYLDQATRLAAAHCLLTYTAYFDALEQRLPALMKDVKLTAEEKKRIAEVNPGRRSPADGRQWSRLPPEQPDGAASSLDLAEQVIAVPHPVNHGVESSLRGALYEALSEHLFAFLSGHEAIWRQLPEADRDDLWEALAHEVPALAESMYRAELVGLAIDFPQFLIWLVLTDADTKDALIRKLGADGRIQFELVGRTVDLGFKGLAEDLAGIRRMLAGLGAPVGGPSSDPAVDAVAADLHARYLAQISKPIIDDSYEPASGPKLSYPTRDGCYVPQAYRLARYDDTAMHLEREDAWTERPVGEDLGGFLLSYLASAYSTQQPLLILGHPGSGKSLLTQVLAARLAYPAYTAVRVELGEVDPKKGIQAQIEAQIREETGEDVSWAKFARSLPSPPVVILDGYDELLQATGSVHADYLNQVREFQEREADLRRPVRVLVTSRITLIDKVSVPPGTTIVRLEEFDQTRRDQWTAVWNARNSGYFTESGVRPFRLPAAPRITELAAQPLLLLMLALYDSAGNQLSNRPDINQTRLYHELLSRFIRRELDKDSAFRKLPPADQPARVEAEMTRLGVAAIGMFNRQALVIRNNQLDQDLNYFRAGPEHGAADDPQSLSQADLLLGSFFFIHESRSRRAEAPGDKAASLKAYEFLHKTFGEFLTADFILSQILAQAETVAQLERVPGLADPLRDRLQRLDTSWFGALVHTPLHTQPNVLTLLREWGGHRLAEGGRPRTELLAALDRITIAQLRGLLTATTLPVLAPEDRHSPYPALPSLGHLAIYSLNLVLLRAYLADDDYVLDEADLDGQQPARCRPWDRLTAIWRSWFPPESLAALAARFTATRRGGQIAIEPQPSPLATATGTALAAAYNVSLAFADNLTTASLGLQRAALEPIPEDFLAGLRQRVQDDVPDLLPALDLAFSRTCGRPPAGLPIFSGDFERTYGQTQSYERVLGAGFLPPGLALELTEAADRLLLGPSAEARVERATPMAVYARLSRYAAEVTVHARDSWERQWLPDLFTETSSDGDWREFLLSPAAAPALRGALRWHGPDLWALVALDIERVLSPDVSSLWDVDTAAAVAVIAWRGRLNALCARTLNAIITACHAGQWDILDIPKQLWGDLADLLVAGDPVLTRLRKPFAETIRARLGDAGLGGYVGFSASTEFAIHVLRIDSSILYDTRGQLAERIMGAFAWFIIRERAPFLLLIRLARENDSRALARRLLTEDNPENWKTILGVPPDQPLDDRVLDNVCNGLTYREAMDLRWAVGVARHA